MTILVMSLWCGLCQAPVLLALVGPAERVDEALIAGPREGGDADNFDVGEGNGKSADIAMTAPSFGEHEEEKKSATQEGTVAV